VWVPNEVQTNGAESRLVFDNLRERGLAQPLAVRLSYVCSFLIGNCSWAVSESLLLSLLSHGFSVPLIMVIIVYRSLCF